MMPFSVLRTWLGGLLGWFMLGLAAYALWEWADGVDPLPVPREVRDPQTGEVRIAIPSDRHLDRQGGWPYLALGIGCLAFSFGGMYPSRSCSQIQEAGRRGEPSAPGKNISTDPTVPGSTLRSLARTTVRLCSSLTAGAWTVRSGTNSSMFWVADTVSLSGIWRGWGVQRGQSTAITD